MDVTYNFTAGTRAVAQQVNQNFADVKSAVDPLQTAVSDIQTQLTSGLIKPDGSVDFTRLQSYKTYTVSNATNATPIVITAVAHGFLTGDKVYISGVGGNTAANGTFTITKLGPDTFSLNGSVGNGAFSSNGTAMIVPVADDNIASVAFVKDYNFVPELITTAFALNSGQVDLNGNADLLAGTTSTTLSFKVDNGTTYKPLQVTYADGSQEILTSLASITGLSVDGTYTVIKEKGLNPVAVIDSYTNPAMTSNSLPTGWVASASSFKSSYGPYQAFVKDFTTNDVCWYSGPLGSTTTACWIQLQSPYAEYINTVRIKNEVYTPSNFKNAKIQGSTDGTNWTDLYTITNRPNITGYDETYKVKSSAKYNYTRLTISESYGTVAPSEVVGVSIQEIEITYGNTVTQGKSFPANPIDGDYHCLTATGLQTYKRVSGAWVETQYVPIGTVTVAGGVISAVTSNRYNVNGYDGAGHNIVETYVNGTSWYRIWSDGWIEQGGLAAPIAPDSSNTITLLRPFTNSNYYVNAILFGTNINCSSSGENQIYSKATTSFVYYHGGDTTNNYLNWEAKGY